ncbi:YcxB family protein [Leptospira sp. FAT2]|uniref:YcxB family protein n=1 Tax=Leptospira sanjuanensis TaxID=2879643 RepID=UPI001EE83C0D|nr:YcxB family protein [Leptospira sanjuanensis]MCG6168814.1 YcxB family protein [Leptospira sanjuanensis]MCG6194228.1 YcxB family protein [Leptospira sanjuanensis]
MKLSFPLNEQDIINFNVYHFRNSKFTQRRLLLLRWLIPIWAIAVFFFLNREHLDLISILWNSPLFAIGILWFLFADKIYYWRLKNNVKNLLKEGRNNGMIGVQNLELTDDAILTENDSGSFRYSLEKIHRCEEGDGYLFLYVTSLSALIIPTNVFQNSDKDVFLQKVRNSSTNS